MQAAKQLSIQDIQCEVIDLRVLNPLKIGIVRRSVEKTGRLLAVDGGWSSCGLTSEVITKTLENMNLKLLKKNPQRITLVDAPAPTSRVLEKIYYPTVEQVCKKIKAML
jgi:pyruvate dehydrogenase E1 component beta subunit